MKEAKKEHFLEEGLEGLHQESKMWSSEVELWKLELVFFQKLLDKNLQKLTSPNQKKEARHFQNLITYYRRELLNRFKDKIQSHENFLASELEKKGKKINEAEYRKKHGQVNSHIGAFRIEFSMFRRELFDFIEHVI